MILIKDATIVNEGRIFKGSLLIDKEIISDIFENEIPKEISEKSTIIDAKGKYLLPGVIDDQVHFREPGLTHKGDIYSESKAAVAGGITSYMEMPNTKPQTTTIELLNEKNEIAAQKSLANYSFYFGATNDNASELQRINPREVCGVKVFMGSSTGNMLVNDPFSLQQIFSESPVLVATHCEDEDIIQTNMRFYKSTFSANLTMNYHPLIRSEEACYKSSSLAVDLAGKYGTRLHVLHLSTAKEMALFVNNIESKHKKITAEVCVHHLWFDDSDYEKLGARIKWNPAIKSSFDRQALIDAVNNGKIDVIATDHAPHLMEEKDLPYFNSMSGGPLVQHSLVAMLDLYHHHIFSLEKVVEKMCHAPADIFNIEKRGYIRKGYFADLVIADLNSPWTVCKENLLYKCGWSPFEETRFYSKITHTFINGNLVFDNGNFDESKRGEKLFFNR